MFPVIFNVKIQTRLILNGIAIVGILAPIKAPAETPPVPPGREYPFHPSKEGFIEYLHTVKWEDGSEILFVNARNCNNMDLYTSEFVTDRNMWYECTSDMKQRNALGERTCLNVHVIYRTSEDEGKRVKWTNDSECTAYSPIPISESEHNKESNGVELEGDPPWITTEEGLVVSFFLFGTGTGILFTLLLQAIAKKIKTNKDHYS